MGCLDEEERPPLERTLPLLLSCFLGMTALGLLPSRALSSVKRGVLLLVADSYVSGSFAPPGGFGIEGEDFEIEGFVDDFALLTAGT